MRLQIILLLITTLYACQKSNAALDPRDNSANSSIESDTLKHENLIPKLDMAINETSGLAKIGNAYWTNNDSGDEAKLYQFDISNGKVIKTVKLNGVKNRDWEELTTDERYMYVGEFGNNTGGRDDLKIFKVELDQLQNESNADVKTISFKYPDQEKFYSGYNHNFDCEAMVSSGDSLFLFSKNWLDRKCKLYSLSKSTKEQTANLISEFDSGGTITAASLDENKKVLYLLGYNGIGLYKSFIWVITDWTGTDFFSGSKKKYDLTIDRQTEGILVDSDGSLLISAEQNRGGYPSLFRVKVEE